MSERDFRSNTPAHSAATKLPKNGKCACGKELRGGECDDCRQRREARTPQAGNNSQSIAAPPIVNEVLQSAGKPLESSVRADMESRFGHDFSAVRVHTGAKAEQSATALGASAYAAGTRMVFGADRYAPADLEGKRLIAHELAHVVQQNRGGSSQPARNGQGHLERDASDASAAFANGKQPIAVKGASATGIACAPLKLPRTNFTPEQRLLLKEARLKLNPKSKTAIVGVLTADDGRTFLLESGGGQGFSSHIEGKATAKMTELGIRNATLLVEEEPCQICDRSTYDEATGPEEPLKSTKTGKDLSRQTPKINTALEVGQELTVVGPESTGHYRGVKPAEANLLGKPSLPSDTGGLLNKPVVPNSETANTKPPETKGASLAEVLEKEKLPTSKLPLLEGEALEGSAALANEALEGTGRVGRMGRIGALAMEGMANFALELVMLVTLVIWELFVVPKLEELRKKLLDSHRKSLQNQIQKKFDAVQAHEIGRRIKACFLGKIKALEQAGKKAYVNVSMNVSFEDTSNRTQIFTETPPESPFDLRFDDLILLNVNVSDKPTAASAQPLARCKNCGTFGRGKTFVTNNPLWTSKIDFSFESPKAADIDREYKDVPQEDCSCFIATACYGSPSAHQVMILRRFRDQTLLATLPGRIFVKLYYLASPPLAAWLVRHDSMRRFVRDHFVGPLAQWVACRRWDKHSEPLV